MATRLSIHPKYLEAALKEISDLRHEGILQGGLKTIRAQTEEATLAISVNSEGRVLEAKHLGAKGAHRAILEGLCKLAVGRPLREVSEHGLIYLEHQMRDPRVPHEVKGLLTPENADPSFRLPLELVRTIYREYRKENGTGDNKNFWTPSLTGRWLKLSSMEQRNQVVVALKKIAEDLHLDQCKIEIIEVRNKTRIVVSLTGYQGKLPLGSILMQIEEALKARLDPQLELTLESIEDRNKRVSRTNLSRGPELSM